MTDAEDDRDRNQSAIRAPGCEPAIDETDPPTFAHTLRHHMARHGDTAWSLFRAIRSPGESLGFATILAWTRGSLPRRHRMIPVLERIERRYQLPEGYLLRTARGQQEAADPLASFFSSQQKRQARWHIPPDFAARSPSEQAEIVDWIKRVIILGGTDYRAYMLEWTGRPYALRFPPIGILTGDGPGPEGPVRGATPPTRAAPAHLVAQMANLVQFKTRILTEIGDHRELRWSEDSAAQVVKRLSLMFGALAAAPGGDLRGHGVPDDALSMALLVVPAVWDWYVQWHRRKRGFYTVGELELMDLARAMSRADSGWLWQRDGLAGHLQAIPGLLEEADVQAIRADWRAACATLHRHARQRRNDLRSLVRVHRDSFEPIRPVLVADNPVKEYRRITSELIARLPCPKRDPDAAAEAVRGYLMLRFGLHLGLRQKNLRELLLCPPGAQPTPTNRLEARRCGELRWDDERGQWLVFVPALAFKNARSSFFGGRPYQMALPDFEDLYERIRTYLEAHRPILLGEARDPGTFFVRTATDPQCDARFTSASFYAAFRTVIERYGVYNPYTKRGAIAGLLPHGPHSIRDVLATHVLKKTGSFLQAGFAIQDAPETVEASYGRFLPEDKSRIAAGILDAEWG